MKSSEADKANRPDRGRLRALVERGRGRGWGRGGKINATLETRYKDGEGVDDKRKRGWSKRVGWERTEEAMERGLTWTSEDGFLGFNGK